MAWDAQGGAEANCHCSFRYSIGLEGGAIFSKTTALPAGTVIDTEAGYVMLGEFDSSEIILRPHNAPDMEKIIRQRGERVFFDGSNSFDNQMDDFIEACLDQRAPLVGGEQALDSLRLIERLYASAEALDEGWFYHRGAA